MTATEQQPAPTVHRFIESVVIAVVLGAGLALGARAGATALLVAVVVVQAVLAPAVLWGWSVPGRKGGLVLAALAAGGADVAVSVWPQSHLGTLLPVFRSTMTTVPSGVRSTRSILPLMRARPSSSTNSPSEPSSAPPALPKSRRYSETPATSERVRLRSRSSIHGDSKASSAQRFSMPAHSASTLMSSAASASSMTACTTVPMPAASPLGEAAISSTNQASGDFS